ncbi:MAG: hypothetical protein AB7F19_02795 [Candidatus Babeliales bacterium]
MKKILLVTVALLSLAGTMQIQALGRMKKTEPTGKPTPAAVPKVAAPAQKPVAPVQKPAAPVKTPSKPAAAPKTTPLANIDAIVQEVMQEEVKGLREQWIEGLLKHPILGSNREDAMATIEVLRKAIVGVEQDPQIQALPSKAQFLAQLPQAPKRALTVEEQAFLLAAARHKKTADVYQMYIAIRPDVTFDPAFNELLKKEALKREFTQADIDDIVNRAKAWTADNFYDEFNNYLVAHNLDWDTKMFVYIVKQVEAATGKTLPRIRIAK